MAPYFLSKVIDMAQKNNFADIESFIYRELQKYDSLKGEYDDYLYNIDSYVDSLRDMECSIEDLKNLKENILKFENKNKI